MSESSTSAAANPPGGPSPAPAAPSAAPRLRLPAANPVFLREMRESMRTEARSDPWRFKLLVLFVLAGGLLYAAAAAGVYHLHAPVIAFYGLAFLEALYVARPVDPTAIIAREKQQNTFEPLMLTPLTPGRFLRGHLFHQTALVVRRMSVMLPLFGAVYILGGFPLRQFAVYQVLLVVYAIAFNAMAMALANTQPGLFEDAGGALAARRGTRRNPAAARLDPLAFLVFFLVLPVFLGLNASAGGRLLHILANPTDPSLSPVWNLIRALGLVHPFLALVVHGDAVIFGRLVPLWSICILFWGLVGMASYFTFIHQIMIRKFRPDLGYRFGRWLLFTGTLVLIAAFGWRLAAWAGVTAAALTGFYAVARFANPMAVPVREPESWELLPRRDLLVHRAGNMFPFLLAVLLPAWAVQALLTEQAALPGLGTVLFYANAALFLTTASLLLGGLLDRMGRRARELREAALPPTPEPEEEERNPAEAKEKKKGVPANPALNVAAVLWILPLALLGFEPLARPTPAGPLVTALNRFAEPLLLLNPFRFAWLLITPNTGALAQGNALTVSGPPPLGRLGIALPVDYFQAWLMAGSFLLLILAVAYAAASRRLARLERHARGD